MHAGSVVQLRAGDVSGQETSHASYAVTLTPLSSVPVAHDSLQLAVPRPSAATNSAQPYSVVVPRTVSL